MKALVICAGGGIGDVLLATPVMRALRARYEDVVALTGPRHAEVLRGNPDVSAVWLDDASLRAQVARIRRYGFDAAVVTWATPRSAVLPFLAGVPVRVGQARRLYSPLFTKRIAVRSELGDRRTHWTQILLDFARALGCDVADATPVFALDAAARAEAARILGEAGVRGAYMVLHPTRGIASVATRWPLGGLAALGKALVAEGNALVVTGSPQDAIIAESVARAAGGVSIAGKTSLPAFGAVAEGARGVVAMDSGPMHVAAALGAPTVGIYALQSDEPDRWAPLGPRTAVVRSSYPCPANHRKETCPDFPCVANLDVARVLAALGGLVAPRPEIA